MNNLVQPTLAARPVKFDFSRTPAHWVYNDVFSSHMINVINLILPIGELWFCRVYNKALPLIKDSKLHVDVKGFINQEAVHSRAHSGAQKFLHQHGFEIDVFEARINWLFSQLLSEAPLGLDALDFKQLKKQWLVMRVGIIAVIEHFTCILGQWSLDSHGWDQSEADPIMADLFRWHLAEEVEHQNVAYDLFEHLCKTELGFYIGRQTLMSLAFPLILYFLIDAGRFLACQDSDPTARVIAKKSVFSLLWQMEKVGKKTDHVPTLSLLIKGTLKWVLPSFHPETEGNTQQALDYLSKSAGVLSAQLHNRT